MFIRSFSRLIVECTNAQFIRMHISPNAYPLIRKIAIIFVTKTTSGLAKCKKERIVRCYFSVSFPNYCKISINCMKMNLSCINNNYKSLQLIQSRDETRGSWPRKKRTTQETEALLSRAAILEIVPDSVNGLFS